LDLAIAQFKICLSVCFQRIVESKRKKRLHFIANLWSKSEFRTQQKIDLKHEVTHCMVMIRAALHLHAIQTA